MVVEARPRLRNDLEMPWGSEPAADCQIATYRRIIQAEGLFSTYRPPFPNDFYRVVQSNWRYHTSGVCSILLEPDAGARQWLAW